MTDATTSIEAITKAVTDLLASIARNPIGSPTETSVSAIRRHGHALYDAAGRDALLAVLARIRSEGPNESAVELRARVVLIAWEGIAKDPLE